MALVFISYTHKDELLAEQLQVSLEHAGHQVWRDVDRNELGVGRLIPEGVASGLDQCDYLAILITKNALSSRWMKQELNTFLMNDSKWENILPLRCDDTKTTDFSGLLRSVKYADLTDFNKGMREVLRRLGPPSKENIAQAEDRERLYFAIDLALRAGSVAMRFYNSCLIGNTSLDERKNAATLADKAAQVEVESAILNHSAYKTDALIAEEEPHNKTKVKKSGYTWVVDPLDGTTNFQNRIPFFCSAIGVLNNGFPYIGVVYDPVANEVYYAINGSSARLWSVARGEVSIIAADQTIHHLPGCLVGTHISSRPEVAERLLEDGLLLDVERNVRQLRALGCGQLALAYVASGRMQLFFQFGSYLWDQVAGDVLVQNSNGGVVSKVPNGDVWHFSTRDFLAAANSDVRSAFLKMLKSRG